MTRLLSAVLYLALTARAFAGVPCILPFTLTNGTLADATQVMANYNALVACVGLAASAGANTDITSLGGLTTPLSASQGGTSTFIGGTSTGTANSQIIASTTPNTFQLVAGYRVIFKAGFANTGPLQINVGGLGLTNVYRQGVDGVGPLVGGEVVAGGLVEAVYDGTQFQLLSNVIPFPVGTVLDTIAATADPGFILMQGQCVSTTTLTVLWVKMGSPVPGSCAAGQFALPDGRGRVVAMLDTTGGQTVLPAAQYGTGPTILYSKLGVSVLPRTALPNVDTMLDGAGNIVALSGATSIVNRQTAAFNVGTGANPANSGDITVTGHIYLNGNVTQTGSQVPSLMLNKQVKF